MTVVGHEPTSDHFADTAYVDTIIRLWLCDKDLTTVSVSVTMTESKIPLVRGRLSRRYPGMRSGCGARGPRPYTLAPGRPGHHACRHYDRRVRCSLDWDRPARATPRAAQGLRPRLGGLNRSRTLRPRPRKPGSGRASGDVSPLGESRGGTPAGGRARFARRRAVSAEVFDDTLAGVPLPFAAVAKGRSKRRPRFPSGGI